MEENLELRNEIKRLLKYEKNWEVFKLWLDEINEENERVSIKTQSRFDTYSAIASVVKEAKDKMEELERKKKFNLR